MQSKSVFSSLLSTVDGAFCFSPDGQISGGEAALKSREFISFVFVYYNGSSPFFLHRQLHGFVW